MLRFALLTAFGLAISPAAAVAATIVALGASNTEGRGGPSAPDGVPKEQAYPAKLQALLRQSGCNATVLNAGIKGDTTGGMLRRAPGVLGADTKVLILQPGGNDARKGAGGDRAGNIASIKSLAAARGIKVVMLESLGQIAGGDRLPDGQHFSAAGHAKFAAYLAPKVRAAGACGG